VQAVVVDQGSEITPAGPIFATTLDDDAIPGSHSACGRKSIFTAIPP
jgi:hypothetical protein